MPGDETDQDTGVAGQRDDQGEGTERAVPLEHALQNLLIAPSLVGSAGVFDAGEPGGGDGLEPGVGVDGSGVEAHHPGLFSLTLSALRLAVGWPWWGRG